MTGEIALPLLREIGAFSISLAVKDIEASRKFYEKFGFKVFMGAAAQKWLIMKNGDHVIGLFQGMFEKNILTVNPGWDGNAQKLASFSNVRELQRQLKAQGVKLQQEADKKQLDRPASSPKTRMETRSSSINMCKGVLGDHL